MKFRESSRFHFQPILHSFPRELQNLQRKKDFSSRQVSIFNGKGSLFWGDSQYLLWLLPNWNPVHHILVWRRLLLNVLKYAILDSWVSISFNWNNLFSSWLQDASGQEFTVVLLDSEGIDAVSGEGSDDHCIFTLTILLASVLIYNSAGVPTRTDLDGLEYPLS